MITTLRISGMTCNRSVQHVTRAIQAVSGVVRVEVDLKAGRATVDHGDAATTTLLVGAVESAGYEAARE